MAKHSIPSPGSSSQRVFNQGNHLNSLSSFCVDLTFPPSPGMCLLYNNNWSQALLACTFSPLNGQIHQQPLPEAQCYVLDRTQSLETRAWP